MPFGDRLYSGNGIQQTSSVLSSSRPLRKGIVLFSILAIIVFSLINIETKSVSALESQVIIPIGKRLVNTAFNDTSLVHNLAQYFVNVTFNDNSEALAMYIDLYEPFVIRFCCSSKSTSANCITYGTCEDNECTRCPDIKRSFSIWDIRGDSLKNQTAKPNSLTIVRNKPNILVRSMKIGDVERVYPSVGSQSYHTIESGYTSTTYWNGLDGVLGMGYGLFNVTFKSIVEKVDSNSKLFAINFVDDETKSDYGGEIYVGKYTIEQNLMKSNVVMSDSKIMWAERQYRISEFTWNYAKLSETNTHTYTYEHRFPIYHLSLDCVKGYNNTGPIDIFGNYSSSWQVAVSSRIDGITLPGPYYDAVTAWLFDFATSVNIANKPYQEWDSSILSLLPALTFVLNDGNPDHHEKFVIPLSVLFGKNGLSLYRRKEEMYMFEGDLVSYDPTIEIGTLVWSKLFVPVFDMANYRVGLLRKSVSNNNLVFNPTFCHGLSKANTCKGAQYYYEPKNQCLDPPCSRYFFQYVNEDTKTCDHSTGFYFAIFVLVGFCVIAEFAVFEFQLRMGSKLVQSARRNTRLPIPPPVTQQPQTN
ncbi:hypothetical protein C9374_004861 [Naegleria lovaniensis]|uniref:Peptidase A1 domain-containing protein n=1 Tax=Naegleria lovaniensis TaxID=51637 RepID=A0AA88KIJ8_NAELO|nr:uncharacterized protein C9374_004861 [Naegleria lovaniensis]KAG2382894.1 hypothetical protein C9374_004861 [Naegleria lovaniensis]